MWSDKMSRDRLVAIRALKADRPPCDWTTHESADAWFYQNLLGRQFALLCTTCGRTPAEAIDALVSEATPTRRKAELATA